MSKKAAFCGDIHFGFENNSEIHNQYLLSFFEWMVDICNKEGIEHFVIMGDFFDQRDKIDVRTLNYGIQACKYIQENFKGKNFINLLGNHDLFYKHRLDTASSNALAPYCQLITDNTMIDLDGHNCLFVPWICDGEHWDRTVVESKGADYMFAHMEFSGFRMNDSYVMEHGSSHRELKHLQRVLTGHYHKRQIKDNVIYPGSPFPFDFGDANDNARGFGVIDLETNEVEFHDWNVVKILSVSEAEFRSIRETVDEHTKIRIELPDNTDTQVIEEIQGYLDEMNVINSRIKYEGNKTREVVEADVEIQEVENIDQSVRDSFDSVEYNSKDIDPMLLKSLYDEACAFHDGEDE